MKKFFTVLKQALQKIINIQNRIILFIFYFIVITPFGLFARAFKDYLAIKKAPAWQAHKLISDVSAFLKKQ